MHETWIDSWTGLNGESSLDGLGCIQNVATTDADWPSFQDHACLDQSWSSSYDCGYRPIEIAAHSVRVALCDDTVGQQASAREAGRPTCTFYLDIAPMYTLEAAPVTGSVYGGSLSVAKVSGSTVQYLRSDALGSIRLVTDSVPNRVFETHYRPFGKEYGTMGTDPAFRFTGETRDSASGLYYLARRHYDPETGRFLQQDPILGSLSRPQTLNRYAYVTNNPLRYVDPTGLTKGCPPELSSTWEYELLLSEWDWRPAPEWLQPAAFLALGIVATIATGGTALPWILAFGLAGGLAGMGVYAGYQAATGGGITLGGLITAFDIGFAVGAVFGAITHSLAEAGWFAAREVAGVTTNRARGLAFEKYVAGAFGEVRNIGPRQLRIFGSKGTYIPDFLSGAEAKAVRYLSRTEQIQIGIENAVRTGKPFRIYVLDTTELSRPMTNLWRATVIDIVKVPYYG